MRTTTQLQIANMALASALQRSVNCPEILARQCQREMINAFHHPDFGPGAANGCTYFCFQNGFSPFVQSGSFGIGSGTSIRITVPTAALA
jgi:hypothetical protein